MPEAPNTSPSSWVMRGSSFSPTLPPTVRAPLLTDYADLDPDHQGHTSTYPTTSTVFTSSPVRNTSYEDVSYEDVHVYADRVSWPSEGPAMYLVPPIPSTTPGSLQSTTHGHRVTNMHQFATTIIPQPCVESSENATDTIAGSGSLNPGSESIAWMQEGIAEPSH
ncbi:hypothetical protein AbraIFM66951_003168 [Aspergillus brasiliensis]|uniref:Uncharacterized protein n=1 Tax=Aspergillus brasiliensis TaxID=319629 RepID=A0A9W6DSR8_9EURO|nr:hypothetical protein AbraCBS73388_002490 [Aspergillus brasiliensis]GKZ50176.1 hypothetical protein AbraIFM66951_003168 [Aspergillus brasiliensis]